MHHVDMLYGYRWLWKKYADQSVKGLLVRKSSVVYDIEYQLLP